jgi:plastocyanin
MLCKTAVTGRRTRLLAAMMLSIAVASPVAMLHDAVADDVVANAQQETSKVVIDNFTFTPETLTITAGTTVTWINRDDIPHVVAEKNLSFKSKALDTDDQYSHRFDSPGEYEYFCAIHPHMVGKIIVKAR